MIKLMEYYEPIAAEFFSKIKETSYNFEYGKITAPHIPGVGDSYYESCTRVAYIGIDTYGWLSMAEAESNLENYIMRSSFHLNNLDHINNWSKGKNFWKFVSDFQNRLFELGYLSEVDNGKFEIDKSYVWGNSNSLEKFKTMKKVDSNLNLNLSEYNEVKNLTEEYDDISLITNAFSPDICIILNWGDRSGKDYYFRNETIIESKIISSKVLYYRLGSGMNVYWTYHPRSMNRYGGLSYFIDLILEHYVSCVLN